MHIMDNTKKIITIIGLIFEGIGVVSIGVVLWVFKNIENIPGFDTEVADMSQEEYDFMMRIFDFVEQLMSVMIFVLGVILVLNLFLFIKLIQSKYTNEQAKKVYLYQAIWGGINLLSNQIVGVLYLISGVGGYNGHKEEKNIREGI